MQTRGNPVRRTTVIVSRNNDAVSPPAKNIGRGIRADRHRRSSITSITSRSRVFLSSRVYSAVVPLFSSLLFIFFFLFPVVLAFSNNERTMRNEKSIRVCGKSDYQGKRERKEVKIKEVDRAARLVEKTEHLVVRARAILGVL